MFLWNSPFIAWGLWGDKFFDGLMQPLRRSLNVPYSKLEALLRAILAILQNFRGHEAVAQTRGSVIATVVCLYLRFCSTIISEDFCS